MPGLAERYWKVAAVLAIAIAGVILYLEYADESERESHDQSWIKLLKVATPDPATGRLKGEPEALKTLETEIRGSHAAPWALFLAATSAVDEKRYDDARAALASLRASYPGHMLVRDTLTLDPAEGPLSAVARLERRVERYAGWVAEHPELFANPELPADAPRVRLKTDRGDIVVGLYADQAPKHVENFLKLVREGFYTNTKFHRVVPGVLIEGGDPNTVAGDVTTWGQGGAEERLAREENSLKHFPGTLSAAKQSGEEGSTSGFLITTGDAHFLDNTNVVFGRVLEGLDVARAIEGGEVVEGTSRPLDPVAVQATEVL